MFVADAVMLQDTVLSPSNKITVRIVIITNYTKFLHY